MKVILMPTIREAELLAYDRNIPPRSMGTLLIATDKPTAPDRARGQVLTRADVITEGRPGRFHDEVMRTLEPLFLD